MTASMHNLLLVSLKIDNFKGIRQIEIRPEGKNLSIHGENASGKTTVLDALLWLLFDKDSAGLKDFSLKTLESDGQALPMIDHAVEAVFQLDGKDFTLKKVLREKWTKKRGSADKVFGGHETDHFVDGVPRTKREYQSFLDDIAPEQVLRTLTCPSFFSEHLSWQERRVALFSIFGSVSDAQVIAAHEELKPLVEQLSRHTIDDLRKVEQATRREINDELGDLPGRIDEASKAIPEGASGNSEALVHKAKGLAAELTTLQTEKHTILSGGQVAMQRKELAELEAEIAWLKTGHEQQGMDVRRKHDGELATLKARRDTYTSAIERTKGRIGQKAHDIDRLKQMNAAIVAEWKSKKASRFAPDACCPTCGQAYPQALRDRQEVDFNREKAQTLAEIEARGAENRLQIGKAEEELAAYESALQEHEAEQEKLSLQIEQFSFSEPSPLEEIPEYKAMIARREALLAAIENEAGAQDCSAVDAKIATKQAELDGVNQKITLLDTARKQRKRVEELKAREKELARHAEQCEKNIYLIEQFIRAKVAMLEGNINSAFTMVSWKLFEEQINGGLAETCICTVNGVPWADLNNAGKIQAGIHIINTLSGKHGLCPFILIDNRESITALPETTAQIIETIVSEADKTLRFVTQ